MELTKVRLSGLVVLTAAAGYILARNAAFGWWTFLATVLGTWLAAAGAMALNQWWERDRDALMRRTANRPLPAGALPAGRVATGGIALAGLGLAVLARGANTLTAVLGLAVVLLYVLVYTPLKTRSTACTLVGALCGALPPMMGWAAATGSLSFGAWVLAGVLFAWQIPHFLALAWLYREDYRRGGFRMLPLVDPEGTATTRMVLLYSLALIPVALGLVWGGHAGWVYGGGSLVLGTGLLALGKGLARDRSDRQARRVFHGTLAYLPLLLALMVADRQAPGEFLAPPVEAQTVALRIGPGGGAGVPAGGAR